VCDGRILGAAVGLIHAEFEVRRAESSTWRLKAGERRAPMVRFRTSWE
jgi:hypothetical protein